MVKLIWYNQIMQIREATVTYSGRRYPEVTETVIRDSYTAAKVLRAWGIDSEPRETFVVLLLNTRHKVIAVHRVAVGSLAGVEVHPREVFRAAVLTGSIAVILAHNHPSGDEAPSKEDRALTLRLAQAGGLLGIKVLDHLILADDRCYSFAENEPAMLEVKE
jgi:DNA repair protein RadC